MDTVKALDHESLQSALYNAFRVNIGMINKYRIQLLLWVVSRICEYAWIHTSLYPIVTAHYHPIFGCMKEVVVEQYFPDTVH